MLDNTCPACSNIAGLQEIWHQGPHVPGLSQSLSPGLYSRQGSFYGALKLFHGIISETTAATALQVLHGITAHELEILDGKSISKAHIWQPAAGI